MAGRAQGSSRKPRKGQPPSAPALPQRHGTAAVLPTPGPALGARAVPPAPRGLQRGRESRGDAPGSLAGRWDALPGAMEENRESFEPLAGQTCRR